MAHNQIQDQSPLSKRAERYLERSRAGKARRFPRQISGRLDRIKSEFLSRFDLDPSTSERDLIETMTRIKPLPLAEEIECARIWVEQRDPDAREALMMSILPRMVRILLKTQSRGERWLDILNDAVVEVLGIIDRMTEFDYEHLGSQVGFNTLHCRVRDALCMERPLAGPRTLEARRAASRILSREREKILGGEVSLEDLDRTGRIASVAPADLRNLHDFLLGETVSDIPDEPDTSVLSQAETFQDAAKIAAVLDEALDLRACDIMRKRWLTNDPADLEDIAATWKISPERVRQIERQSLQDLRDYLEGRQTSAQISRNRAKLAAQREREKVLARRTPKVRKVAGVNLKEMRPFMNQLLDETAREVVLRRYFLSKEPGSYQAIAQEMSLTAAEVRQIENAAFAAMRDFSAKQAGIGQFMPLSGQKSR